MARPERRDADYFPFYAKDGKTLFILEEKYGCKGTGFFTNVMRFLTLQEDHHFCIKEDADRLYFFSKTKCDEESGLDMLNIMSKTRKINTSLWVSYEVIASQDLLGSLSEAYRNRKNDIITIDEILEKYVSDVENPQEPVVSDVKNPQEPVVSDVEKPQRKGKERKGKETKGKVSPKKTPVTNIDTRLSPILTPTKEKKETITKEIDDELVDELKKEYPHIDIDFELEKYEHWQYEKPPGKKHKDKKRGFRNWIKQANKWQKERASPNKKTMVDISNP